MSLGDFDRRYFAQVASLPLIFQVRRGGAAQLDEALAHAREHLDEWQAALDTALQDDSLERRQQNLVSLGLRAWTGIASLKLP